MEKKTFKLSIVKELFDNAKNRNEVKAILKEEYGMNPREIEQVMIVVDAKGWKPEKYAVTIDIVDDTEEVYPVPTPAITNDRNYSQQPEV